MSTKKNVIIGAIATAAITTGLVTATLTADGSPRETPQTTQPATQTATDLNAEEGQRNVEQLNMSMYFENQRLKKQLATTTKNQQAKLGDTTKKLTTETSKTKNLSTENKKLEIDNQNKRTTIDGLKKTLAAKDTQLKTLQTQLDEVSGADDTVINGEGRKFTVSNSSNERLAKQIAADAGWTGSQWKCLRSVWAQESQFNHKAKNPSSGAYGIPQSLPGSKMASAGSDWETNPETQIKWGISYIKERYGSACGAYKFKFTDGNNWY